MNPVAVIGAGISGCSLAWKLRNAGVTTVVFDPAPQAGGVIRSVRHEGYLLELGPNTVLEKGGALGALIDGLDLRGEVVPTLPLARKRFILHHGRPVAAPSGPLSFWTSSLLGFGAKCRIIAEPLQHAGTAGDESVAAFFSRRIGRAATARLVDPFVSGIYAGDPVRLSARFSFPRLWAWERESGSLLRGALRSRGAGPRVRARMLSFRGGLAQLPQRLAAVLGPTLRREAVRSLERRSDGWWVNGDGPFGHVVTTLPPWSLQTFLREHGLESDSVSRAHYPSSAVRVWHFGLSRSQVGHSLDGFGVLAPSCEGQDILGILFSSSIFADRAPADHVLLTLFQGGVRGPQWTGPDPEARETARSAAWASAARWLDIRGEPSMVHHHLWNPAIPQYEVGHQSRLDALEVLEATHPGLHIAGNLRGGVSVADCVESSFSLAERILASA